MFIWRGNSLVKNCMEFPSKGSEEKCICLGKHIRKYVERLAHPNAVKHVFRLFNLHAVSSFSAFDEIL